jgi:hypothetical protein
LVDDLEKKVVSRHIGTAFRGLSSSVACTRTTHLGSSELSAEGGAEVKTNSYMFNRTSTGSRNSGEGKERRMLEKKSICSYGVRRNVCRRLPGCGIPSEYMYVQLAMAVERGEGRLQFSRQTTMHR